MQSCVTRLWCAIVVLSCASAWAVSVNVNSPGDNASVTSPFNIKATASPGSGFTISGWQVYVDGNSDPAYSTYGVTVMDTNLNLPVGTHTVQVKVWDTSGNDADQTITVNVANQGVSVDVKTPGNGATVFSPVDFEAFARSANPITGWHIYMDGNSNPVFGKDNVSSIDASVAASPGSHTFVVRAWDATGANADQTLTLNVASSSVAVNVSSPGNNATVSSPASIQASATSSNTITGWHIYVDSADVFSAGQTNSISPSVFMSPGSHAVVVRAWDSTGAYSAQSFTVNVVQNVQVSLSSPGDGATVSSPVPVQASATSGNTITGWHIYVDSVDSFSAGQANSINASLPMANGSHTLVIRAWDSSGAFGDQTATVNVVSTGVSVVVSTPQNNSTVSSPVMVRASAQSSNPATDPISGWHIYVDGTDVFGQTNVSSINTALQMSPGTHTVVVRAWDSTTGANNFGDQTLNLTVSGTPPPPPQGNAYTNIDDINPWSICTGGCGDNGGSGAQPETSQAVVSSPSEDGSAHQFSIGGNGVVGNAYWFVPRGPSSNPSSPSGVVTSQTYSFDLLIPSADTNAPQAIEWETQQQFNGTTYNTGWQADYHDVSNPTTMNIRTFQYGSTWFSTGIVLPRFTPDTFHHIQVDETVSGSTISFNDIFVDGVKYVPTNQGGAQHQAVVTGKPDIYNNAFQLDMQSNGDPSEVFIDNMQLVHNP